MKPTADQEFATRTTDRDLCVVAGAGSGKTSVLTGRFVHLALEEGIPLDRILTLTFTDRAALEMRERVGRRFGERGRHDLRRETAAAWIGTFHSFCARLLKENAIEAGVDPAFTVLAEAEASVLLERAREAVVARRLAEDPGSLAPLAQLATGREGLEADLGDLLDRCRGFEGDPFATEEVAVDPAPALAGLRRALRVLRDDLDDYTPAGRTKAEKVLATGSSMEAEGEEGIAAVVSAVNLGCGGAAKANLLAVKEAAALALEALVGVRAVPVARALRAFLRDLDAAYRAEREARGALDFHDLERRALDLLRGNGEVREEVRSRFDHLLVDEFQDTNPVQEALLDLLRRPERLFVVGDPKQAIYGFRGADHGGFLRAQEAAGSDGLVRLRENFRSRGEILAFANAVLEPAFRDPAGVQVEWQELRRGAEFDAKAVPSVELHLVEGPGDEPAGTLREREAALLADRLRALVAEGGAAVTARDAAGDSLARPLRWGDAAILLRATTDMKTYERALAERDVPFQVVGGRGFFEAREVVDLANLLEAVDNPRRELPLAAALRSPFGGLGDDALLALAEERRRRRVTLGDLLLEPRSRIPGLPPAARRRWEEFRALFRDLRDRRGRGRLVEVVERAVEGSGCGLAALLRRPGRQRAANLRKVREQARLFEGDGAGGLGEFVRAVRRLRLREVRETEAPLESEDAVSLLTVHQAKGLEWPLVLLPDTSRAFPAVSDPVLLRGGRAGISLRGRGGTRRTAGWRALAAERKARDAAEGMRVLHVAITRAREHLIVSSVKGGSGPWWRALIAPVGADSLPRGEGTAEVPLPGSPGTALLLGRVVEGVRPGGPRAASLLERHGKRFRAGRGVPGRLPKAARAALARTLAALPPSAPPPDATPYLATVSALLDFGEDPAGWRLRHRVGVPDRAPALPASLDAPRRDARPGDEDEVHGALDARDSHGVPRWISGVAVHAVLGTMDFLRGRPEEVAAAARLRLREELEEEPPEAAVRQVAEWVGAFRASGTGAAVADAARRGDLHREVPFLLKREGVILRGQIDLLYRDAAGAWIVADYKASPPPRRRGKADRYARQVRLYAEALHAARGEAADRGLLVYLESPDSPVEVDLSPAPGEVAADLLEAFARHAAGV